MPYKFLFYFGFLIIIFFIYLSFWQYSKHLESKNIESKYNDEGIVNITISDINSLNKMTEIEADEILTLQENWLLRSRVMNGKSGYNLIQLYNKSNKYVIVNRGWVPLNVNLNNLNLELISPLTGILTEYDVQTIGQDDIRGSSYLFRIDKEFIENEKNLELPKLYVTMTNNCGVQIICLDLYDSYNPPHFSYAMQWLFFSFCLLIVILRKNKFI